MGYKEDAVRKVLEMVAENGYKAYLQPEHKTLGGYGFFITPDRNVMYVQYERFEGYRFSLQYKPSAKTGSGCSCNDDGIHTVSMDDIKRLEKSGLKFARSLKATLYNSPEEWFENHWGKDQLIVIGQEVTDGQA